MTSGVLPRTIYWILIFIICSCSTGNLTVRRNMSVVFYNVENLFDIENSEGNRDAEFTPDGKNKWDESRYQKKVDDIAHVLHEINAVDPPEIIGLCEVENEQVVLDLVRNKHLAEANYEVVHFDSPDMRGIDCALIYRPSEFKVLHKQAIPVHFPEAPRSRTRDIVYVKGYTQKNDEFHIFINHWPSRIGGVEQTEHKRLTAAGILREKVDSVLQVNSKAYILIMGDMNDEPVNRSLSEVLRAFPSAKHESDLVNLMYPEYLLGNGSYKYRGSWDMLDNIIVSGSFLQTNDWYVVGEQGYVFRNGCMEYTSPTGLISPNKTYSGSEYKGGVSDHFPVYIHLRRK